MGNVVRLVRIRYVRPARKTVPRPVRCQQPDAPQRKPAKLRLVVSN